MSNTSPSGLLQSDALHNAYMATVKDTQACWGNWPPTDSRLTLGAYGWGNGMTFNYLGNISGDEFDVPMPAWTSEASAAWNISSEQLHVQYLQAQAQGQGPIPVDTID